MKYLLNSFFFWLILAVQIVHCQKFKYANYSGEDFPFTQVNQVIEDSRSFIWLATDQGLFRFDGTKFEDFNTTLRSRYIHTLIRLDDQAVLFSNDTGVYKLYYKDDTVTIDPYLEVDETISDLEYPRNLMLDETNRLWIGQLDGEVFVYNKEENFSKRFQLALGTKTPKMIFEEDSFGTVWILIPKDGLYYFDEKIKEFQKKSGYDNYQHLTVQEDHIYLAGDQVVRLQVGDGGRLLKTNTIWSDGPSFSNIAIDETGLIILSSSEGLYTMGRGRTDQLRPVFGSNDPHRVEQLPFTDVNQIYFSSDQVRIGGKIWLSTADGLGLLYSGFFKSVSGLAMDNTLSLGRDYQNQILVSQGNLFRIRHRDNEDAFDEFETDDISITAITDARKNFVWLGTSDAMVIKAKDRRVSDYDLSERGGGIFYMYEDSRGKIWFCQAPTDKPIIGVATLNNDGQIEEYGKDKGLNSRILVVDEGGQSELYAAGIGTKSYLYKLNRVTNQFENKSLPFPFKASRNFEVHDISVDTRGIVWLATTDGLLKYDTERIQRIPLGIHTQNEIRSVVSIPDGSVWMATSTSGLIHLDSNGNFVLFDERSGTPSKIATYRALLLDQANRIWAGTAEGVVYSVMSFPAPLSTKKPSLEKVQVNAQEIDINSLIKFKNEDVVDFYFSSIAFPGDENQFRYRYYFSGVPEDEIEYIPWILSEGSTQVRIRAPDAGAYIMEVCTQKPGGYSWSLPIEVPFIVRRPWYSTIGGIGSFVFLGMLLFVYGIRFYGKKKTEELVSLLSRKEKELTAKKALIDSQEEAIKSAGVSIHLLNRLIRQIPKRARWNKILPSLSKLVELQTGIDAFEIAFLKKDTVQKIGFHRGTDKIQQREVEFNEKENLTSYVYNNKSPLLIENNDKEASQYVIQKDNRGYLSRIYVPFEQIKGSEAVLCIYAGEKDQFTKQDLTIVQILAEFLSANVTDELK